MTSFVHVEQPTEHPGVIRAERAAESLGRIVHGFDSARGAATLLLAAIVAALLVVTNQVVDTWTEGRLLAAWIVMWTVAFASLALLASPVRRVARGLRSAARHWAQSRREAREDAKLWQVALTDARVMADISRAMSRDAGRDVRGYY